MAQTKERASRTSSRVVTQALVRKLGSESWAVGDRLPSTRDLGRELGANRATVQRALRDLEKRGLVECRPRSGWYVRANSLQQDEPHATASRQDATGPVLQFAIGVDDPVHGSLLQDQMGETWLGSIVAGARDRLARDQIDLLLLVGSDKPQPFFERIDQRGNALGGLVIVQPHSLERVYTGLEQRHLPWVVVDRPHNGFTHNFVTTDNVNDCRLIGYLFAQLGYKKIFAATGNPARTPSCGEKVLGLMDGFVRHSNRAPRLFQGVCGDSAEEAGYTTTVEMLKQHGPPDGILATGDKLAIGAIRACEEAGLKVPNDVGVVGTTGLEIGAYTRPSLTVTTQQGHQMGEAAADMLLQMVSQNLRRVPGRSIPGELIVRESLPLDAKMLAEARKAIRLPMY